MVINCESDLSPRKSYAACISAAISGYLLSHGSRWSTWSTISVVECERCKSPS